MQKTFEARHVGVSIGRSAEDVYRFTSNPENLSHWASGLGTARRGAGGEWIVNGPLGEIRVRFAERNALGVLDHDVTLPSGVTVHNPLRVLPNGEGSEVVFSVFRLPGRSEQEFAADAATVEKDLRVLKQILERP